MRSLAAVAALEAAAVVAAARGPYKWSQDRHVREWRPARETPRAFAHMPLLGMLSPPPPAPTAPPMVQPRMLEIRATDNTCAYISGNPDSSLYCDTGSACVYNSGNSHIGCCPETDVKCPVFTTCLDSTQSSLFTSNNGFTLLCTSSDYPYCLKHVFGDDIYFGYNLLGCGRTAGSDRVFFSPTTTTTTTSSSSSTTSSSSSSTSTSSSSHSQTTTPVTPQSPTSSPDSSSSSPPIAPIVGGAVGGFAALGLIGLGAAFLMRRSHKPPPSSSPASPQPPAPGPPPSQSIMGPNGPQEMAQQHHYPQGYAAVPAADTAAAATKAQDHYNPSSYYDPDLHQQQQQQQQRMSVPAISPLSSPPIQQTPNQGQVQWAMPAPTPQQQQQQQQPYQVAQPQYAVPYQVAQPDGQPYQVAQPQQQHQQHPGMGYQSGPVSGTYQAAELDARPETQLRELPS